MSARDHVGASRALLGTADRGSEVYGTWRWGGGLLLVDAFRPDRYRRLHLTGSELDTPLGARIRELHEAGTLDPTSVEIPEPWVRAAVVDAVDRWVDLPLDANLLLADRALALAEAGDGAATADLYERARQGLADLVDRVDGAHDRPEALLDELTRVLRAAPDWYGVRPPRRSVAPSIGDTFAALEQEDRRRRARAVRYLLKGAGDTDVDRPTGSVAVLHHPLLVPARLLKQAPVADVTDVADSRIQVVAHVAAGVSATTPAARRLLVSAVDARTLRVGSVAPFVLRGDTFRGTVRPVPGGTGSTLVVVHDGAVTPALSLSPEELPRAASLTALRDAYGAERLAAAHAALRDPSGEVEAHQARLESLLSTPPPLPGWLDLGTPLPVVPRLADACRPLLAELGLAHT